MSDLEINRFTKQPVTIDAVHLTDDADWEAIAAWCGGRIHQVQDPSDEYVTSLAIPTLDSTAWASGGDWVIRGVRNEFYPCKPDIFDATYVVAAEHAAAPAGEDA